jgi:hypothetical protein
MCNVVSTLGRLVLFGALAFLMTAGFDPGWNSARADNKKPAAKPAAPTPPRKVLSKPLIAAQAMNLSANLGSANVPHHEHSAKAALALPKAHAHAHEHPPLLAAIRHMEEAFAILEADPNLFLGIHRLRSMKSIEAAYMDLNIGLEGIPGPHQPELTPLRQLPPGKDFPPIRHALQRIRSAQEELKQLTPNLRGYRRGAVERLNDAVYELDLGMRQARLVAK